MEAKETNKKRFMEVFRGQFTIRGAITMSASKMPALLRL